MRDPDDDGHVVPDLMTVEARRAAEVVIREVARSRPWLAQSYRLLLEGHLRELERGVQRGRTRRRA